MPSAEDQDQNADPGTETSGKHGNTLEAVTTTEAATVAAVAVIPATAARGALGGHFGRRNGCIHRLGQPLDPRGLGETDERPDVEDAADTAAEHA